MKEALELFLDALAQRRGEYRGLYTPRYITMPTPINAIKKKTIEVYMNDDGHVKMISSVSDNVNITDETALRQCDEKLIKDTIDQVLKYYGVQ